MPPCQEGLGPRCCARSHVPAEGRRLLFDIVADAGFSARRSFQMGAVAGRAAAGAGARSLAQPGGRGLSLDNPAP